MKIGSRYKIARRLGSEVFEKTQTQKFALSEQKRNKQFTRGSRSNYGKQLLEKQKTRFTYLLSEKQFSNYVRKVIATKSTNPSEMLFSLLESRLDNIVLRAGFASTRFAAKQMVSHGHITVNGRKVSISSYHTKTGDVISVKEGSKSKGMFQDYDERAKDYTPPTWLKVVSKDKSVTVSAEPKYVPSDVSFDLLSVLQYYKR